MAIGEDLDDHPASRARGPDLRDASLEWVHGAVEGRRECARHNPFSQLVAWLTTAGRHNYNCLVCTVRSDWCDKCCERISNNARLGLASPCGTYTLPPRGATLCQRTVWVCSQDHFGLPSLSEGRGFMQMYRLQLSLRSTSAWQVLLCGTWCAANVYGCFCSRDSLGGGASCECDVSTYLPKPQ